MTEEVWKPVVGWEGLYEVSSRGRFRSLTFKQADKNGRMQTRTGVIRKVQRRVDGHLAIDLKNNGMRRTYLTHRLIAEAFIPNPDNLPMVRHLNDVPDDNRVENLAWGTMSDNLHDAVRNGIHFWAKRDACANGHKYTEESSYRNHKQRVCRTCKREVYGRKEPPNHGTYSGYVTFGCRCTPCVQAGKDYRERRKKLNEQSKTEPGE